MSHNDRSSAIFILFLVVLALGLRLLIVFQSTFPLNDGGLFYAFINDLLNNDLALPAFSSYNAASIPLAYPPLAFYSVAILSLVLDAPVLQLLQCTPALLSVASIPAFYLISTELLESRRQAALATLVFSLLPRTFDWLIMGGGITRALGLLFALLAMRQAILVFAKHSRTAILPAIIFGSLLVYSHPEAAAHTVVTGLLLYLWKDRSRGGLRNAAIVAGGIVAVTAPWWLTIVVRHGLDPFLAASSAARQDSYNALVGLIALFRFDFTDEPFLRIFAVLGLLGLAVMVARREYFLPVWLVLMHAFEPRGGTLFMMIPLAMAAGFCLDDIVLPALGAIKARNSAAETGHPGATPMWLADLLRRRAAGLALGFLALYGCIAAYSVGSRIQREMTLTAQDLRAFEWVRANTPQGGSFALVTGGLPLRDASSEWFPALTNRRSVATVFGTEWVRSVDFGGRVELSRSLQHCMAQHASCLETWAQEHAQRFDYVYVHPQSPDGASALQESLDHSANFEQVYADGAIAIYARQ